MVKEVEKQIEQYIERLRSAIRKGNIEDGIETLKEMRSYLTGIIDLETDPIWRTIGYLYVGQLEIFEALLSFAINVNRSVTDINSRLTELEERVARIEDELGSRREYRLKKPKRG